MAHPRECAALAPPVPVLRDTCRTPYALLRVTSSQHHPRRSSMREAGVRMLKAHPKHAPPGTGGRAQIVNREVRRASVEICGNAPHSLLRSVISSPPLSTTLSPDEGISRLS